MELLLYSYCINLKNPLEFHINFWLFKGRMQTFSSFLIILSICFWTYFRYLFNQQVHYNSIFLKFYTILHPNQVCNKFRALDFLILWMNTYFDCFNMNTFSHWHWSIPNMKEFDNLSCNQTLELALNSRIMPLLKTSRNIQILLFSTFYFIIFILIFLI